MLDVKTANEIIINEFANTVKSYLNVNNYYELGDYIIGKGVKIVEPLIEKTLGGSDRDTFPLRKPQSSKQEYVKTEETIYNCIIELSTFNKMSKKELISFVKKFLISVSEDFQNQVGNDNLIGSTFLTMELPGFEGKFIRTREDGNLEIRVYTDLTKY